MADLTATADAGGAPAPFVDLAVVGPFPPSAVTVTVSRTCERRTFKVRGMVGLAVGAELTQRDYEAPFDRTLTYQAEFFNAAGTRVGVTSTVSVSLPALVTGAAWWHKPLDPSSSIRVFMGESAAAELNRPVGGETLQPVNRSVGVVIGGVRQGLTGAVLDCVTLNPDESARFDSLFGDYDEVTAGIVCVRASAEIPLPPVLFARVASPKQRPYNRTMPRDPASLWSIVGDEVAPPAPAIVRALLTYQDFEDFYSSYAEFEASYASYLEASRDYSVKG